MPRPAPAALFALFAVLGAWHVLAPMLASVMQALALPMP